MAKKLFFFLLLFIPLSSQVFAQSYEQYPPYYLRKLGIDFSKFHIAEFSGNHRVLLAIERVNSLSLRFKGYVWVLRVFRFNKYNQLMGMNSILLHISDLDNQAVNTRGTKTVIIAQYGTEILEINLRNKKPKLLFIHRKGRPGFLCRGFITYYHKQFYVEGYYYDSDGYWVSDAIARLNFHHPNSVKFFKKTWNIGKTRKYLGVMRLEWIVSGNQGFLGASPPHNSKIVSMYYYHAGKLEKINTARAYGGWAAANHRILYNTLNANKTRETIIKDLSSGKTWILAIQKPGQYPYYQYPYLSQNGNLAVIARPNYKRGKISFYYAMQKNDFHLEPISNLQNVPLGIFRLSPDGKRYAFQNRDGLIIGTLP